MSRDLVGTRSRLISATPSAECALVLSSNAYLALGLTLDSPALTVSSKISRSVEPNESRLSEDRESFRARLAVAAGRGLSLFSAFTGRRLSYLRPGK